MVRSMIDRIKAKASVKGGLGTCTVSIVMLDRFGPGILPDAPTRLPARSDVASFHEIYALVTGIFHNCVFKMRPKVGWSYTGLSSAFSNYGNPCFLSLRTMMGNSLRYCVRRKEGQHWSLHSSKGVRSRQVFREDDGRAHVSHKRKLTGAIDEL